MSIQVLNDLSINGSLIMLQNNAEFPSNPAIGTMLIKEQCLFAYIRVGGLETWYPFASKTESYIHTQGLSAISWLVTHNLNTTEIWYQVKDQNGQIVMPAGKRTVDANSFYLDFTTPVIGTVIVVAPSTIDVPEISASIIKVGGNDEVIIDSSGVRINGSYALTSAGIEMAVDAEATIRANADTTLQANINAEITARTNADTTLQANINAEITARAAADTTLQANINTEITARTNADATLQSQIDALAAGGGTEAEASARIAADATLQANINAEITARTNADATLQANINEVQVSNSTAISTTSLTAVDTWSATTFRSAKYVVQVTQGSNYQVSEILVIHNGTTVSSTEYAMLDTNGSLVTFTFDINSGNVRLLATMASATSATIKLKRAMIAV